METSRCLVRRHAALVTLVLMLVAGCRDEGSSGTIGVIGFEQGPITVSTRSHREVTLSLKGGTGVAGQRVTLSSSNTTVADVTPSSCTLSGSSEPSSRCVVKVHGKSKGSALLLATAAGYADVALGATVGDDVVYGNLAVGNGSGTLVTTSPIRLPISATAPYQVTLLGTLQNSSGITASTGAYINFSTTATGVSFDPAQCQVTTASPTCTSVATLASPASVTITAALVGAVLASHPGYTPITVDAAPGAVAPGNGTIALSTQSGNNVPIGMKAPLFLNWTHAVQADTVTVDLTISGPGASFYRYAPGNNTSMVTSQTQSCTLTYTGTSVTSRVNCGFGLVGSGTPGSVTISGTATGSAGPYTIAPLVLGVVPPDPTRRSVTFTNASSRTIYVGITGGAASAYLNDATPAVPPGTTTASMKPGAGSLCGPSNPQAACPIGTTCLQGGAAPNTSIADTPFYCYYDQPAPSNGYQLASSGTTTFNISGSSASPGGILWSGNFYARTGCDPTTGMCENATCAGSAGGLACGPGTGPTPGTNTLAEATFQLYPATDFYDVSIINGANFATAFGPTNLAVSPTDGYFCGTAGSASAVNGGYAAGSIAGLPASPWVMSPTPASFPPDAAIGPYSPASHFRVVVPSTGPGTACQSSDTCTTAPDTACGWPMSSVAQGAGFDYAPGKQVCGRPVAWMTADTIWGQNSTSSNRAPFAFSRSFDNGNGGTVAVSDLQLCINGTYSPYLGNGTSGTFPIQPVTLACGGVMWGASEDPGPQQNPPGNVGQNLTQPTQPVQTANAHWIDYVLPTIAWLKKACPTCYTYPFDDMSSTFTCSDAPSTSSPPGPSPPLTAYGITFSDLK